MAEERKELGWREWLGLHADFVTLAPWIGGGAALLFWLIGWLPAVIAAGLGGVCLGVFLTVMSVKVFVSNNELPMSLGINQALLDEPRQHRQLAGQATAFQNDLTIALKLQEIFDSEDMARNRIAAAKSLKTALLLRDEELLDKVDTRVDNVLDVFESVGFYLHENMISAKVAHHHFFTWARGYWYAAERYRRQRRKGNNRALWEHFEELINRISEIDAAKNKCEVEDLKLETKEIEEFLDDEISIQRELEVTSESESRITELLSEKASLEKSIEALKTQHQSEKDALNSQIRKLNEKIEEMNRAGDSLIRERDLFKEQRDSLQNELGARKWVDEIIDYQRNVLSRYVLVEECAINVSPLSEGKFYFDFTFNVRNYSMFHVSIPMLKDAVIEGSIYHKGEPLSGTAKLIDNRVVKLPPYGRNYFKIRQWVNPNEAEDIPKTLKQVGNLFGYSEATVYIKAEEFPDDRAAILDLTRAMQNAELESKVITLENEVNWLRRGLTFWHMRASCIRELNRTLGMFYLAYNQLEQNEILSKDTANNLKGRFMQALFHCFGDHKREDEYSDNLPTFPNSIPNQMEWINSQCEMLRALIDEQQEELSNYVQKDGSTPNS